MRVGHSPHYENCHSLGCPCYIEGQGDGVRAAQRAAAELPPTMDGLLTYEEHADLNAALAHMANQRRRVEADSRDLPLGHHIPTTASDRRKRLLAEYHDGADSVPSDGRGDQ